MNRFKYIICVFFLSLLFTGCQLQNNNNFNSASNAEDILEGKVWSEVDTTQDKYVLREFYSNQFVEKSYATKQFKELVDIKYNDIIKYNDDSIDTVIDGVKYKCYVCSDSSQDSITFSCDPLQIGGETSCATLWRR